MDLNALSSLIVAMRPSFRSPEQQQLDTITKVWMIAVGESIAVQTRPIRYERHSLTIAVRQGIWAQQLTAQTHQILQRLRPQLPPALTIKTLRFRVAPQFYRDLSQTPKLVTSQTPIPPAPHPSHWPIEPLDQGAPHSLNPHPKVKPEVESETGNTLHQVVDRWRLRLDQRSPNLEICPRCHCPTPPAELDRWQMCALCATTLFQPPMALGGRSPVPEIELK